MQKSEKRNRPRFPKRENVKKETARGFQISKSVKLETTRMPPTPFTSTNQSSYKITPHYHTLCANIHLQPTYISSNHTKNIPRKTAPFKSVVSPGDIVVIIFSSWNSCRLCLFLLLCQLLSAAFS